MFDSRIRPLIDPPLNTLGRGLARAGVTADAVTLGGFVLGLAAACAIGFGVYWLGFLLIALNRLADGLDGAVARATQKTDHGGYLDITLDFVFYGAIPLAFAVADPAANAVAAAALLASFYANGSAFLAFAISAEKLRLSTDAQGIKSFFYLGGIAEGTETIAVFLIMCLFPAWFAWIAWAFAAVCFVSAFARIAHSTLLIKRVGEKNTSDG